MEERFRSQLIQRSREGTLRSLRYQGSACTPPQQSATAEGASTVIDFASNDYLGLARCPDQLHLVEKAFATYVARVTNQHGSTPPTNNTDACTSLSAPLLGSTGSRLLSGDTSLAASLESFLAKAHNRQAALLFNSGYDANLSVLGCSLMTGDVVILDELCHNSLVMGVRMSRLGWEGGGKNGAVRTFKHNDVQNLVKVLNSMLSPDGKILIVVESVYSMDGDVAPLRDILDIAASCGASVIVDEAHGLGVYGTTNVRDLYLSNGKESLDDASRNKMKGGGTGVLAALDLELHPALLCSVHTFGKAAGCHGAVVAASQTTVDYLINYARPFVYSTSPPPHALVTIRWAYETMMNGCGEARRRNVFHLVRLFRLSLEDKVNRSGAKIPAGESSLLLRSPSPIQAVLVPGNHKCIELCSRLSSRFDVHPIRSPTVPKGKERVRIILHSHNSEDEVLDLVEALVAELTSQSPSLSQRSKL